MERSLHNLPPRTLPPVLGGRGGLPRYVGFRPSPFALRLSALPYRRRLFRPFPPFRRFLSPTQTSLGFRKQPIRQLIGITGTRKGGRKPWHASGSWAGR